MERTGGNDVRAVVADEVALVRLGVTAVLEPLGVEVVAETHSGREATRLAAFEAPELVVVGTVADMGVGEVIRRLKQIRPTPAVIGLLPRPTDDVAPLLALDANGLALRTVRGEDLARLVERVLKGERVVTPALLRGLAGAVHPRDGGAPEAALTTREREVLALLAEGRSNREIAADIYVTVATVKSHVAHLYTKLGAANRSEALARAVTLGLLG